MILYYIRQRVTMIKITKFICISCFLLIFIIGVYLIYTDQQTGGWSSLRYSPLQKVNFSGYWILAIDLIAIGVYMLFDLDKVRKVKKPFKKNK
jgi:cytosine/uracil/thiamine/allantoin permease